MESPEKQVKYKKQDEFWQGIIQKYEDRNIALEQEQLALQERVDQMEAAMPAVVAFNMTKLAQQKPDAAVDNLVPMECHCMDMEPPKTPLEIPDLTNISVFSIEDADVHYMDKIKELAGEEKKLIDDVNKLRSKEKALKGTKQTMDEIMDTPAYKKGSVDSDELQRMNQRLMEENRRLSDDVADLKLELKHTRETIEGPMTRELERERRKVMQLENDLKGKSDENSQKNSEAEREIHFLKNQLEGADKNLSDMIEINNKLKDELDILNIRSQELQNDLINQKISEANTLALLKAELNKKDQDPRGGRGGRGSDGGPGGGGVGGGPPKKPPPGDGPTGGGSKGSLYKIARDLSHDLVETKDDHTIPEDLKGTVEEIKDLCDLIDQKFCSKNMIDDDVETTPVKDESIGVIESMIKPVEATVLGESLPTKSVSQVASSKATVASTIQVEPSKQPVSPSVGGSKVVSKVSVQPSQPEVPPITEEPKKAESILTTEEVPSEKPGEIEIAPVEEEVPEEQLAEVEPVTQEDLSSQAESITEPIEEQTTEDQPTESEPVTDQELEEPTPVAEPSLIKEPSIHDEIEKAVCPFREQCIAKVKKYEEEKKARALAKDHASLLGPGKSKSSCKRTDSEYVEEIEIITELEATGETDVETDVKVIKKTNDGFNVTTTVTRSGTLEVTTEGPAGLIETTMTVTDSGNIEVITEFTESVEKGLADHGQDFRQATDFGDPGGRSAADHIQDSGYEADTESPKDKLPTSSSHQGPTDDTDAPMETDYARKETDLAIAPKETASKMRRSSSILRGKSQELAAIFEEPTAGATAVDYIPSREAVDEKEFLPQKDMEGPSLPIHKSASHISFFEDDKLHYEAKEEQKEDIQIEKAKTVESPSRSVHGPDDSPDAKGMIIAKQKSESILSVIEDAKSKHEEDESLLHIKASESLLSVFEEEGASTQGKQSVGSEDYYSAVDVLEPKDSAEDHLLASIPEAEAEGEEDLDLEYSDESSQEEDASLQEDQEMEEALDTIPEDQLDELRAHSILQGILNTIHSELSEIRKSTTSSSLESVSQRHSAEVEEEVLSLGEAESEVEGSRIEGLQMGVEVDEYEIDEEFVGEYELGQEEEEEEIAEVTPQFDEVQKEMVSEEVQPDLQMEIEVDAGGEVFDELLEEPEEKSVDIEEELALDHGEDKQPEEKEEVIPSRPVLVDAEMTTDVEKCECQEKEKLNETIFDAIEKANKNLQDFLENAEKEMGSRLEEILKEHEKKMAAEANAADMRNIVVGMVDDAFWRISFEDRVDKSGAILEKQIPEELPESYGDQPKCDSVVLTREESYECLLDKSESDKEQLDEEAVEEAQEEGASEEEVEIALEDEEEKDQISEVVEEIESEESSVEKDRIELEQIEEVNEEEEAEKMSSALSEQIEGEKSKDSQEEVEIKLDGKSKDDLEHLDQLVEGIFKVEAEENEEETEKVSLVKSSIQRSTSAEESYKTSSETHQKEKPSSSDEQEYMSSSADESYKTSTDRTQEKVILHDDESSRKKSSVSSKGSHDVLKGTSKESFKSAGEIVTSQESSREAVSKISKGPIEEYVDDIKSGKEDIIVTEVKESTKTMDEEDTSEALKVAGSEERIKSSDTDERSISEYISDVVKPSEAIGEPLDEKTIESKSILDEDKSIKAHVEEEIQLQETITATKEESITKSGSARSSGSSIPVIVKSSKQSSRQSESTKSSTSGSKIPVRVSKTESGASAVSCSCTSDFVCTDCYFKEMMKSKDMIAQKESKKEQEEPETCCKECECDLMPPCLPECAKVVLEQATDMQGDKPLTESEAEVIKNVIAMDENLDEFEVIQEISTDMDLEKVVLKEPSDFMVTAESLSPSKEDSFVEGCMCYLKGAEPTGEKPDAETMRKGCCCYLESLKKEKPSEITNKESKIYEGEQEESVTSEVEQAEKATLTSKVECLCDKDSKKAIIGDNVKETITEELTPEEQDTEEVQELRKLVKKIRCACKKAESLSGPGFTKKASDFKSTLSGLQVALDMFQEKCRTKDVLIDAMKEELKLRARSKIFDDLLQRLNTPNPEVADYTRALLADSLPKPSNEIPTLGKDAPICICEQSGTNVQDSCNCIVSSEPLIITDIKRVGPTSIKVNWDTSSDKNVIGYEIYVNNVVKGRMYSPQRTCAILDLLDLRKSINVRIYAISNGGRCYPAATALYEM